MILKSFLYTSSTSFFAMNRHTRNLTSFDKHLSPLFFDTSFLHYFPTSFSPLAHVEKDCRIMIRQFFSTFFYIKSQAMQKMLSFYVKKYCRKKLLSKITVKKCWQKMLSKYIVEKNCHRQRFSTNFDKKS